jgi:hypothetical protein
VCRQAAATLTQAMAKTTDPFALQPLAQGLSAVAARLEPKEAAAVCGQAAAALAHAMSLRTNVNLLPPEQELSAVAARLEPKEAGDVAAALIQSMSKRAQPWPFRGERPGVGPSALLLREEKSRLMQRRPSVAGAVGVAGGPGSVLVAPVLLQQALQPLPPPLPAQTLVDLLKQPFCVGEARRLVLDQLQRHYQRPFADQWDFVRFVQQENLDLDLKTPPRRPGPVTGH